MKKILCMLCLVSFCVMAMAGNPFKSIEGKKNMKEIMASDGKALIVFDWSEAKYDKNKDLKTSLADDYDFVLSDCEKSFVEGFNEKSKKLLLATDASGAKYKFILKITSIDRYFQPMTFVPKHEAKMWGCLEIIDIETGNSLVKVTIDEAEEGYDLVPKECFGKTFLELGKRTAKLK